MESTSGQEAFGWLLGDGEARGMALAFVGASLLLLVVVLLAFVSKPYRELSAAYAAAPPSLHTDDEGEADAEAAPDAAAEQDAEAEEPGDAKDALDAVGEAGEDLRSSVR